MPIGYTSFSPLSMQKESQTVDDDDDDDDDDYYYYVRYLLDVVANKLGK